MRKFLLYSAILTCGSVFATSTPVNRGDGPCFEITENGEGGTAPTEVPSVTAWQSGQLETKARIFDLVVTGNCDLSEGAKLKISAASKRPDLFITSGPDIVFAEPQPMTTVTMPKGSNASVIVTLESIRDKYSDRASVSDDVARAEDYLCLGIRKGNEIINTLYIAGEDKTHASGKINMNSEESVELVPLLSTKKLSTGCEIAQTGAVVSTALAALGNTFDFSSVYRVHVAASNAADIVKWVENLSFVCESEFTDKSNWTLMGVGAVKDKDGKIAKDMMFACYWGDNDCGVYSEDGVHWIKHTGTVPVLRYNQDYCESACGDGTWCAINGSGECQICSKPGEVWSDVPGINGSISALFYSNGIFVTIVWEESGYKIYTLDIRDGVWSAPVSTSMSFNPVFLCCNEDSSRWIASTNEGKTYFSTNNGVTWDSLDDSLVALIEEVGTVFSACCYSHGYFYACVRAGYGSEERTPFLARSLDGNKWEKVHDVVDVGDRTKIIPYKNRLYLISKSSVTVGMFDPSDSGPTAD